MIQFKGVIHLALFIIAALFTVLAAFGAIYNPAHIITAILSLVLTRTIYKHW